MISRLILLLFLSGCACVTKQQHRSLVDSFDRYYQETQPLVVAEINSTNISALRQVKMNWLRNAEQTIESHKRLSSE